MKALARLSTSRTLVVVLAWVALVAGLLVASAAAGPDFRDTYSLKGADSDDAYVLLEERFPSAAGDTDQIVIRADSGTLEDWRSAIETTLDEVASSGSVTSVVSPLDPEGASQLSTDGTVGYASVTYTDDAYNLPLSDIEAVGELAHELDAVDGLTVGHGGYAASRLSVPEVGIGELAGLAIAAVILIIAFGSGRAATVPLISAVVAVTAALGVLGLLTNVDPITTSAPMLAVLLGLGVGIDYALFIVNRHRLGLKAGKPVRESIVTAMTTSGRAVVFAGITVAIALLGMVVPQIGFLTGLALTAAVTVSASVAASTTLVPALLALYGDRVLSKRERAALASAISGAAAVPTAGRFARWVERRPAAASLAAVAILVFLAIPVLSIRLGTADQGNDPAGTPSRVAFDSLTEGFGPGVNGALVVVADVGAPGTLTADVVSSPSAVPAPLAQLGAQLVADEGVASVIGPLPSADGSAAMFQVIPTDRPQAEDTEDLVSRIRHDYVPDAEAAGYVVNVGGATASNIDFTDRIADSIPLFFTLVVGLSMIVLLVAFRSIVLPLVGALLNLLSAAAAFGVVVAIFQWGWGHQLIGIGDGGPIEPFIPLILFALLFGLSMDYQVFLVSRMAELWHATSDSQYAVRRGLAEVSRVIVAAASIMVVVFGSFVTSESRIMKLLGLGLAVAIALDAFVIRVVLMPAIMRVLGRASWWMPAWLDRIVPHIDIDGHDDVVAAPGEPREPDRVLAGAR
jgi:RND superfamily putative drug exporter